MRRALVLGLGDSGLAMARWLAREGWQIRVADTREDPPMRAALCQAQPEVDLVLGPFELTSLEGVELLAISPGLPPHRPPAAALVAAARKAGLPVVGEIELFAQALTRLRTERGHQPKVIGVTGTNGKTTTTRLTGKMVQACGRDAAVAGNIAPCALDVLAARLEASRLPEVWVLELSSFQLETTASLVCHAGAILNISEDHLDWHETMAHYTRAKQRILVRGATAVLNRADAAVMALAPAGARASSFGPDAPVRSGEFGLVHDRGIDWLALAEGPGEPAPRRRALHPDDAAVFIRRLMPSDALRIHGRHNALNAMAALALARAIGCPLGPCLQALREYRGESHRTERVAVKAGVEYYDDSKATNVGATLAAIEGLAAGGRKLVVILGGDGKQQRFAPLAAAVAAHARATILIGRDGPLIGQALQGIAVPIESAATLPEAVRRASALALAGDAVLLSPACASFDMFRNYAHRAEVCVQAVQELSDPQGAAARGASPGDDPAAGAGQAGERPAAKAHCA